MAYWISSNPSGGGFVRCVLILGMFLGVQILMSMFYDTVYCRIEHGGWVGGTDLYGG